MTWAGSEWTGSIDGDDGAATRSTAWAAAQHVVANSYDAAVSRVAVAGRQWQPGSRDWSTAASPADPLTVVVTYAG